MNIYEAYLASIKNEDLITVDDGVEAMSDCEHRARFELFSDGFLYKHIGSNINCSCCFIEHKDLRPTKQCSSKT